MTGRKLSHYEIIESLGLGGMGEVYRGRDTRLGRDVAIKILPADRPFRDLARRRFQREAMAASQLNHPNIVTIYEINSEQDTDFIVMEYVRGQTLHSLLRRTRLSVPQVLRYAVQIADAVAKAHSAGIIHRDLKPGNVMITEDGLVKVLDFGLAKFDPSLQGETNDREGETVHRDPPLSVAGSVSGTLSYMSPEQARGDPVDSRSDIFSFGILVFQLLSGELPFQGPSQLALMHNLHFNPPKDLSTLRPETPRALVDLVSGTLEKDPAKRIQAMAEVATELRRIAHDQNLSISQESALAPTVVGMGPSTLRRAPWHRSVWMRAAGGLIVLLVVGIGVRQFLPKIARKSGPSAPPVEDNAFALYKRARENLDHFDRQGSDEQAITLLGRALQLDPNSAASYAALAEAYYRKNQGNPDPQWVKLTAESANHALSLNSDLASSHLAMGMADMQAGHAGDAEKEFRAAAELDPKSSAPHRWLGVLFDKTNKGKLAAEELSRAVQLSPDDWKVYMEMGLNAYQAAEYQHASQNWEHALKLEPDNVPALLNLGAVYQLLERNDDAATALQHALEVRPNADTYGNLGTLRFYQGQYQDSVSAFEKALALGANNYDNWANLADAYRWTPGNADKAKQAYQRAIQLVKEEIAKTPNSPNLRAALAMYLAKSGDKVGAMRELQLLEPASGKQAATLSTMTIAYELCGERDKALNSLQAALQAGQSLADIRNEPELAALRADPRYHLIVLRAAPAKVH